MLWLFGNGMVDAFHGCQTAVLLEMLLARLSQYFLCSLASFQGSAVVLDMHCEVGHMDMAPGVCLWKAFPM